MDGANDRCDVHLAGIARLAAGLLPSSGARISLVDAGRVVVCAAYGSLPRGHQPRIGTLCARVANTDAVVLIADTRASGASGTAVPPDADVDVRFYAGIPLRNTHGSAIGTLSVFDANPRSIGPDFLEDMALLAALAAERLELRQLRSSHSYSTQALRQESAKRLAVSAATPALVVHLSADDLVSDWGGGATSSFLWRHAPRIGSPLTALTESDAADALLAAAWAARAGELPRAREFTLRTAQGNRYLSVSAAVEPAGAVAVVVHETTRAIRAEIAVMRQSLTLSAIAALQADYVTGEDARTLFVRLILRVVFLTDSEWGFFGEVTADACDSVCFSELAIADVLRPQEGAVFFADDMPSWAKQGAIHTVLQRVVQSGEPALLPDERATPHDAPVHAPANLVPGYPLVRSMVLIPVKRAGKVVAVAAVANRVEPYDDALLALLLPFFGTCANVLEAHQAARQRHAFVAALKDSETRVRAILEGASDVIFTVTTDGTIASMNPAVEPLLGYAPSTLIGTSIWHLLRPHDRPMHGKLADQPDLSAYVAQAEGARFDARHASGSVVPVELRLNPMKIAGRQKFAGVMRDLTERQRIERMKTEFVSTVSHELRTPLTSIRGSLGLVVGGVVGEADRDVIALVTIAQKNADRLIRLINDILDIERIESGELQLKPALLSVGDLLSTYVTANLGFAQSRGVSVQLEVACPEAILSVDCDRLEQVITNLVSNAVKFSKPGDAVIVRCARLGGQVRISVCDSGPGISEAFKAQVFRRFAQADGSDARAKEGTGLGLSIVQQLTTRMGGRVWFESALGVGTSFFLEFPEVQSVRCRPSSGASGTLVCITADRSFEQAMHAAARRLGYSAVCAVSLSALGRPLPEDVAAVFYDAASLTLAAVDCSVTLGALADAFGVSVVVVVENSAAEEAAQAAQLGYTLARKQLQPSALDAVLRPLLNVAPQRASILYVEPDHDLRALVLRLCPSLWSVTSATSIAEARSLLARHRFDVTLLDLVLPDGPGEDLLEDIGDTPVVVFSARELTTRRAARIAAELVKTRASEESVVDAISDCLRQRALLDSKIVAA